METKWIWPFELLDKLGEGGMGVVYRARYLGNDRQVAVKLLPSDSAANATLLARFEREMVVLKQLRHPHIVHCFGGTCEGKQHFYAMELIEGGTLSELLRRKKHLSWETVVDYAIQMAEALQYAHEHGVIHRDIKPSNFLVTKQGKLKLSDFGLVTVSAGRRLTATGRTLGTVDYMSPEQIRGKPALTFRSDLYALGCVIFEMATGNPPFVGENQMAVLHKHLKDPPPGLSSLRLDIPEPLDALVSQLLDKTPEYRPESAGLVARRLQNILQPGRFEDATEPTLFPAKKTVKALNVPSVSTDSSESITTIDDVKTQRRYAAALIASTAFLLFAVVVVFGWRETATSLAENEQFMISKLDSTDPTVRTIATEALSRPKNLQKSSVKLIRNTVDRGHDEGKIAAMIVMSKHPQQFRSSQWEVYKLQKDLNVSPMVRHQADLTINDFKNEVGSSWSAPGITLLTILLIVTIMTLTYFVAANRLISLKWPVIARLRELRS